MSEYSVHCDDGGEQLLNCKKLDNGKYVLVYKDESVSKTVSEEFDDIEIYNSFDSPAYIFVKKHNLWGMYQYFHVPRYTEFIGRSLKQKEKCCYTSLEDLKIKYLRGSYEQENEKCHIKKTNEDTPEFWLKKFKRAKETDDKPLLRNLRKDIFKYTEEAIKEKRYAVDGQEITLESPGKSTYYSSEIQLEKSDNKYETQILVLNEDCLKTAFDYKDENPLVLNMASRRNPGGGVENGAGAQEEYLCRASNYTEALYPLRKCYPMDRNFGGIYSPSVTVFRGLEENGYPFLKEPFITNFVAVAALNRPDVNDESYAKPEERQGMVNKVRTILGIAASHNHKVLILGAFGCGAFHNPASEVARIFKEELESENFKNRFEKVIFSIKTDHNDTQGNYSKFAEVFK
ncbi:MAG: TIGR02452 family protein [Treponema sp.]|nr:TIGR02452 family protein [Treponema sp.]